MHNKRRAQQGDRTYTTARAIGVRPIRSFLYLAGLGLQAALLMAQPGTCFVGQISSGCSATGNPTVATFVGNLTTQFAAMNAAIAPLPQPASFGVYPNVFVQASDRVTENTCLTSPNSCVYSTATSNSNSIGMEGVVNAILANNNAAARGAGITGIWYNADPLYWSQDPNYAAYCAVTGTCVFLPNAAIYAAQRNVDLAWMAYAVSKGLKIRISWSPLSPTWVACETANPTQAQLNACLDPLMQAAATGLANAGIPVEVMLPAHEPTGYWQISTGVTYTAAQFTAIINTGCAAIHTATSGSTIKCGGGFTVSDGTYITNYIANATADDTVAGLETYGNPGSYASTMATMVGYCPSAKAAGMICVASEGNPPVYVQSPNSGSEQNATPGWGCAAPNIMKTNVFPAWVQSQFRYLSAYGFDSGTYFGTELNIVTDPRSSANCYPAGSTGSSYYAMQNSTGATPSQAALQQAATWNAISAQGFISFTGNIHVSTQ
jgi:hypothetical protein